MRRVVDMCVRPFERIDSAHPPNASPLSLHSYRNIGPSNDGVTINIAFGREYRSVTDGAGVPLTI